MQNGEQWRHSDRRTHRSRRRCDESFGLLGQFLVVTESQSFIGLCGCKTWELSNGEELFDLNWQLTSVKK
jgi:hypothetical protein